MLDAEADELCQAQRYERSADRIDTRAGHYKRKLHPKAGEVELKMPKLRRQTFETAIIERYRRRDISTEEAIVQHQGLPQRSSQGLPNSSALQLNIFSMKRTRSKKRMP
jgi:transposase-like protein